MLLRSPTQLSDPAFGRLVGRRCRLVAMPLERKPVPSGTLGTICYVGPVLPAGLAGVPGP